MFKRKFIFVFFIIFLFTLVSVSFLGHLIDKKMSSYVTEEVNKVSKILIRKILNDEFFKKIDTEALFIINKNSNDEIELIDLDTIKVNNILGSINDEIFYYFNEFDNGNIGLIKDYSNIFNNYISKNNSGLFINVPMSILFSNSITFGVGPSIPVKIILTGQVESEINTSIRQYGINNVLLEISVIVKTKEKIIFPFSSEYVDVSLEIPLVIELISGKVPENYLNTGRFDIIK